MMITVEDEKVEWTFHAEGIAPFREKWFVRQFIKYDDRLMVTNSGFG